MKRINFSWLIVVVLVFSGCSRGKTAASPAPVQGAAVSSEIPSVAVPEPDGTKRVTIGFSVATATFIVERWNKDVKVFSGAAQELGADVLVQLSAGGTREQIAQINYMANQKIDILVVIANNTEMMTGVIKQVRDAGIPVIAYDRMIMGVPIDAYISFDNREVGRKFGQALTDAVPRGKYLVVNGSLADSNSYEVNVGLHEILDPPIAAGDIELVQEIWLEEWSFDEALEKVGAIFEERSDFDAISCGNDQIAGAVIQLLSERRLAGKVMVVGQDAELISCQYVVEGLQLMTVYKPIGKLAVRAAQLAMSIVEKHPIPPATMLDNQSGTMVPGYIEMPVAVDKTNMDVVIRDGFHSQEDIYRNVMESHEWGKY
ncbi:D-xylose-binding protein [Treponema primitia ZAS-2]|uniref:D-xylose-binding protein n=1 Tax=Treponema primitia (strain ATCC BAA-887 / DSM 12427 / ZAS-2) TaxID=545694 RepID=F5YNI0_TREPZ|nr:substrate-binding domain-containing protein [Treponema primitia]AEF86381.1 D-xylose-binding protein [Treponema primitia ZAS-2]